MTNLKYIAALLALVASAAQADVGIASGQPGGTNYPMVDNIVKVCSKPGSPINNVTSDGSLDNIAKVYSDKTTQFSITQMDAAYYMKGVDPRMMERILMVFPFFSTEIQIAVRADSPIRTLGDLQGKRVIEGPGNTSGTWVTAQVIKKLTGLQWQPLSASIADGAKAVLNGQADAEVVVAGAPTTALDLPGLRILPLNHPGLDGFALYTRAFIPSGVYKNHPAQAVQTYKVDNAMITYAFQSQYQKEIGDLVGCIAGNIGRLQSEGHAKWRDVNPLDIERIKWPAHPAAVRAIKSAAKVK